MASRKKATKDETRELTTAETYYIANERMKQPAEKIAEALNVPVTKVQETIRVLEAGDTRAEPTTAPAKKEPDPIKVAKFSVHQANPKDETISVSMTEAQSMADDDLPKGPNREFLARYEKNLHIIKPK